MERETIKLEDLLDVVRRSAADDPRLAIFMLNDMGFEQAIRGAQEDGDKGLEETIRTIDSLRTEAGEDAVRLIDMIDELRMD